MTMSPDHPNTAAVKATLDRLMQQVSALDFDVLDEVYHPDMRIYMLGDDGALMQADKPAFAAHVASSMEQMPDPNPWAEYHLVEANDRQGHVLISRKNNVADRNRRLTLSIDFIRENDRWQITREVIMTRPDTD